MKKSELRQIIREEISKLINENTYFPYQFDDERGKELYLKYNKSLESPLWKEVDGPYEKKISLSKLLSITGMTLDELKELSSYSDSGWSLYIDEKTNTVTEYND